MFGDAHMDIYRIVHRPPYDVLNRMAIQALFANLLQVHNFAIECGY